MSKIQYLKDVEYIIIRPRDIIFSSETTQELSDLRELNNEEQCSDIDVIISKKLTEIGVSASLKGYRYIITAIREVMDDEGVLDGITKVLYPVIAKKHNSTAQRVEKAIRHAIEAAWKNNRDCDFKKEIQNSINNHKSRPTNSEFIALLSRNIKAEMR